MNREPTPRWGRVVLGVLYIAAVFIIGYWAGLWIMSWTI